MKKLSKILVLVFVLVCSALVLIPFENRANDPIVEDKKAIDCGAWFGTECEGRGEGCDTKPCDDPIQ
jgi:hypothetical protein